MDVKQKFEAWARSFDSYRTPQREWTWLAYHAAHSSQQEEIERLREALKIEAGHLRGIAHKALHWESVFAMNDMAAGRWSEIKRWAGHRANVIDAALNPTSASGAKGEGNG